MNPYVVEVMIREKREDMLREAARLRLIAEYEAGRRARKGRIWCAVGELLIRLGERLKNRYEQKVELPVG